MMSIWRRVIFAVVCACITAAFWLIATPCIAAVSPGDQPPDSDLSAILLNNGDVPPGFELDPKQSGFKDEPLPGPSWSSPITRRAPHMREYDRVWRHRQK